jgi:hypothetical protein
VAGVAARDVDEAWDRLARPAVSPPGFDPALTDSLPEPARRWLTHAIAAGTPLAKAVTVSMRGHIRLGRWIPFRAAQVNATPAGFIWAALLVPTAWLQEAVTWKTGDNDDTVVAEWHVDDHALPVTLTVGPDGALRSLTMPRWAQPRGHPWVSIPSAAP